MPLSHNIIIQDTIHKSKLLSKKKCTLWLSHILKAETVLTIRIVDEDESQLLNKQYRKKNVKKGKCQKCSQTVEIFFSDNLGPFKTLPTFWAWRSLFK